MPWLAGVHPLEKLFDFVSKKNGAKKVKQRKVYISKGKGKERMILLIFHLRQQLGTIVGPKTNILLRIRVAHGLPPWKIVGVLFFNWVLARHHIFWEIGHFWEFRMKQTKKVKKNNFLLGELFLFRFGHFFGISVSLFLCFSASLLLVFLFFPPFLLL